VNAVLLEQGLAALRLIGGRPPFDIEDLIKGPEVGSWIAVTIEAPFHQQRRLLIGERHLVDTAVA
jgi:hypothetical protein